MLYSEYLDYWMREYFEINYKYSTAKRYKESFGDMDIVIRKNIYNILDIQTKIQEQNLKTLKNGDILSFLNINNFQIDLFISLRY